MKFIETTEGFINTSVITSVVRINPVRNDGYRELTHAVRYREHGENQIAYTWESEHDALVSEIIPAAPGYSVLRRYHEEADTYSEDVIAWRIHRILDHPVPITADGAAHGDFAILEPSGSVIVPFDSRYDTRADFDRNAAEEWRKEQESKTESQKTQQPRPAKRLALAVKKPTEAAT